VTVIEFSQLIGASILTDKSKASKNIKGIYICDLLSWVMSHASKDDAWVTVHTNFNILAVASLIELACIIIPEGIEVDESTLNKANDEEITILTTNLSAYDIACKAYENGIK
jgi:predicted transcriptional regulator